MSSKVKYPMVHHTIKMPMIMRNIEKGMMTTCNPGICITCGNEQDHCEPDACGYKCDACGKYAVCGAQELLLRGWYHA